MKQTIKLNRDTEIDLRTARRIKARSLLFLE
jgi:hypothetical protein